MIDLKKRRADLITALQHAQQQAANWQNRAIGLDAQLALLNELDPPEPTVLPTAPPIEAPAPNRAARRRAATA